MIKNLRVNGQRETPVFVYLCFFNLEFEAWSPCTLIPPEPPAQTHKARRLGPAYVFLPAADDSLAWERQVQETSADFKGEGILQGVAVDDEGYIVLFAQQLSQVRAVLSDGSPCCLEKVQEGDVYGLQT